MTTEQKIERLKKQVSEAVKAVGESNIAEASELKGRGHKERKSIKGLVSSYYANVLYSHDDLTGRIALVSERWGTTPERYVDVKLAKALHEHVTRI